MKFRVLHPTIGAFGFAVKDGASVVLGRDDPGADLQLNWDPRISRRHARLSNKDGELWFEDLASKNGSFHGTQQIEGLVRLERGMSILIGETVLFVVGDKDHSVGADTISGPIPTDLDPTQDLCDFPVAVGPTDDLRDEAPSEKSGPRARVHPRFVTEDEVVVELKDRHEFRQLLVHDISRGGMFVATDSPPPLNAEVRVELKAPGGTLRLKGKVIHTLSKDRAETIGLVAGAGIQFIDLGSHEHDAIRRYIDRLNKQRTVTLPPPPKGANSTLSLAEKLLAQTEDTELYGLLDLPASSTDAQIASRLKEIDDLLDPEGAAIPDSARSPIRAAKQALARMAALLSNPHRRLVYDFRSGHIRAEERLKAAKAGSGPSLNELRRAYNEAVPDLVDKAAFLTRRAFALRQNRDVPGAIEAAKDALELNPFFVEMMSALEAWEALVRDN